MQGLQYTSNNASPAPIANANARAALLRCDLPRHVLPDHSSTCALVRTCGFVYVCVHALQCVCVCVCARARARMCICIVEHRYVVLPQ